MKGITPIIATIVLLFITMALLVMAYPLLTGMVNTQKNFTFPNDAGTCSGGIISVYITNTGQQDLVEADFDIFELDGTQLTASTTPVLPTFTVDAGRTGKITGTGLDCDGVGTDNCASGLHTVRLGIGNNIIPLSIRC